jgi:hypothetical protein
LLTGNYTHFLRDVNEEPASGVGFLPCLKRLEEVYGLVVATARRTPTTAARSKRRDLMISQKSMANGGNRTLNKIGSFNMTKFHPFL